MIYRMVWKHKTNKHWFAEVPHYWKDTIVVIDEAGPQRELIHVGKASSFDYKNWTRVTIEEMKKVQRNYKEIYGDDAEKAKS